MPIMPGGPVPCPNCSYDLRGVPVVEGLYRCPECGCVSNLETIVHARLNRERFAGRWIVGGLIGLIVILLIILGAVLRP